MPIKFSLVIYLLVLCLSRASLALSDYDELCAYFKDGIQFRKPGSCDDYVTCTSGVSTVKSCESPKVFNPNSKKCEEATASNTAYCKNSCEGLDGVWKLNPIGCEDFFYCADGQPLASKCANNMHFDEDKQLCVHIEDSACVVVANICAILPDKSKFRDVTDCSKYYECDKNGKLSHSECKTGKYFDVESSSCVTKKLVDCNAHPKTGICSGKKPYVGLKPDGGSCRGFFNCRYYGTVEDVNPTWYQCPEGTFFDYDNQGCSDPTTVLCVHNRCDGRGNLLVTSSSNDCHNFIRCADGKEVKEETCHWDYFFDEKLQGCTPNIIYDKCCDGQK